MAEKIKIKGARVHNLKGIHVELPKDKLVVITGLSGSGKSSLAFDTIYAEGQRRYMESLSIYARQFLKSKDKADVDQIEGLTPAIAIDQRPVTHNPRSTVGTMTEIYDHLRLLFAHLGQAHCPRCEDKITSHSISEVEEKIIKLSQNSCVLLLAPVVRGEKGEHKNILQQLKKAYYDQVRIDGYICSIDDALSKNVDSDKPHTLEVVVDRVKLLDGSLKKFDCEKLNKRDKHQMGLFYKLVKKALDLSDGQLVVFDILKQAEHYMGTNLSCSKCKIQLPKVDAQFFSFNSPKGACRDCKGLGTRLEVDEDLVIPNKKLTIEEGAIRPWSRISGNGQQKQLDILKKIGEKNGFSLETPINKMDKKQLDIIFYGLTKYQEYEGIADNLLRRYNETSSSYIRSELEKYMKQKICSSCQGMRLKREVLGVVLGGKNISQLSQMNLIKIRDFLKGLSFNKGHQAIAKPVIKEIVFRLALIIDIGLDYLSLDRSVNSLSGGEVQKIRLATQISSDLSGVVYVLDEPSIGLHERDNQKLLASLRKLQKLNNTVIVVEHDRTMIEAADWVIDIGPGAGKHGGKIVSVGSPDKIKKDKKSLTGQYLSGKKHTSLSAHKPRGNGKYLEIIGASEFNLKDIDVKIPLGKFVCLTGVSGSGKSTLMNDIVSRALAKHFYGAKDDPGKHKQIKGLKNINKVVTIDQSPIGRTPRSNTATYTGVFTYIRDLFADLPEAKIKGFEVGQFSFNVKGGRCEACQGDGVVKIEMNFLPDIYVECEECHGRRYNNEALEIYYYDKNIADVLDMTVEEAMDFFDDISQIKNKLKILNDVGLGYLELGQPAPTLSGGEAQRVKLATELSRRSTGKTLYILDEPTIGLHADDVNKLLKVLNKLADKGNTVLVIEHNLDVIKSADWIIDLGPEGGDNGGELVVEGTPAQVVKSKKSYTGYYLNKLKNK